MKLLTNKKERSIIMATPREVSKLEKLLLPPVAMIIIILMHRVEIEIYI